MPAIVSVATLIAWHGPLLQVIEQGRKFCDAVVVSSEPYLHFLIPT